MTTALLLVGCSPIFHYASIYYAFVGLCVVVQIYASATLGIANQYLYMCLAVLVPVYAGFIRWVVARARARPANAQGAASASELVPRLAFSSPSGEGKSWERRAQSFAHDFNNVLMIIGANASHIARNPGRDEAAESGEHIAEAVTVGSQLCDRFLSRRADGCADVVGVTRTNVSIFRSALPRGVVVEFDDAVSVPAVTCDAAELSQIILNLLSNARYAVQDSGRIEVTVGVRRLSERKISKMRVGAARCRPGSYVFVRVTDDGRGMDDTTQQRMFDRAVTTRSDGHGLGLSTVRRIVREHGGCVSVESVTGKGTSIWVNVPSSGNHGYTH